VVIAWHDRDQSLAVHAPDAQQAMQDGRGSATVDRLNDPLGLLHGPLIHIEVTMGTRHREQGLRCGNAPGEALPCALEERDSAVKDRAKLFWPVVPADEACQGPEPHAIPTGQDHTPALPAMSRAPVRWVDCFWRAFRDRMPDWQ